MNNFVLLVGTSVALSMPVWATVQVQSSTPSPGAPQVIGTTINWTVTASDTSAGPLTFQFNVAPPGGSFSMIRDFNVGTYSAGTWTALPFVWTPTLIEGSYQIQVVAKDFGSGETATSTVRFQVNPLATGNGPVVAPTANPLVALFSAPACAPGSKMRVDFKEVGAQKGTLTSWIPCHKLKTMTFEIAGMYPSTTYHLFSQTDTAGTIVNGPTIKFTTGALPATHFPKFTVNVAPGSDTDTSDRVVLIDSTMAGQTVNYPELATDLTGKIIWYYYPPTNSDLLTRPLSDGILMIEGGPAWNPASQQGQLLRKIDWAGNIIKETNTGVLQQELLALGATDAQPCNAIPSPAPVGAACLGEFNHDFIQTLPNGYSAVLVDIEKIYPAGTQGNTSGLPVDIIGDMIVVLNNDWQAVWYFDAFEHAGGPPQLDINRRAPLGETCTATQPGCPPAFLLGPGIAPLANDWLHSNSLYYWPAPQDGLAQGDLIWSSRHQDWVMLVDYRDGTGTGNILWRMGNEGDFTFNNIDNDPWPWFSHQHDAGILNPTGYMALFDNGNTRLADMGSGCAPNDCDSRGMAVQFDQSGMQVTPILSLNLGVYSSAVGAAQLLANNNYFFMAGLANGTTGYAIEALPTPGTITATQVFNLEDSTMSYRAWRMTNLYTPPVGSGE
jgi:arylsulfate sulfotransferase